MLCESDALCERDALWETDALSDCEDDTDSESLMDSEPAVDPLPLADIDPDAADSLADIGAADAAPAAALAVWDGAADPLCEPEVLAALADWDAVDSLDFCEVDALVDSVPESEVDSLAPVLPGARTVLPSVARVLRFAAVTS